jgi:hypothetical protein
MLVERGAKVVDLAGMGALYAAVAMNSLQWVQGRPAPILSDSQCATRQIHSAPSIERWALL